MLRLDSARTVCLIALVTTSVVLRNVECATAPEPGDLRGVGKSDVPDNVRALTSNLISLVAWRCSTRFSTKRRDAFLLQ